MPPKVMGVCRFAVVACYQVEVSAADQSFVQWSPTKCVCVCVCVCVSLGMITCNKNLDICNEQAESGQDQERNKGRSTIHAPLFYN